MNVPRQTQNHSATSKMDDNVGAEVKRLRQADEEGVPWRRWGPYSERPAVGHGARGL